MLLILSLIIVVVIFAFVYSLINIKKIISITIMFVVVYFLNLELFSFFLSYFYLTFIVRFLVFVFLYIKSFKDLSVFSLKITDSNLIIFVVIRCKH